MCKIFWRYIHDESGATAIEYGLLAALLGVSVLSAAAIFNGGEDGKQNVFDCLTREVKGQRTVYNDGKGACG